MSLVTLLLWLLAMAVLVLVNAFFVATEFALVASRKSRIQELAEDGHPVAPLVQRLQKDIDASVSGTQLGITFASLSLGWVGEHSVHELVKMVLGIIPGMQGVEPPLGLGFAVAFMFLSSFHVVFGEQVPKFLSLRLPEKMVMYLAPPFRLYCKLAWPFIWLMNRTAGFILKLMGVPKPSGEPYVALSAEELEILIDSSYQAGELNARETDLLKRVLDMKDLSVEQVMIPRKRMDCVSDQITLSDLLAVASKTKHSKLPVYKGNLDQIAGILNTKDLFDLWCQTAGVTACSPDAKRVGKDFNLWRLLRPAFIVSKTARASTLLDDLRSRKIQMAVVVDESRKTVGLVTMEDLLEQLVGEIYDEYDKQPAPVLTK